LPQAAATIEGGRIFVLGIDVGTGGTRTIVIDGTGRVISSATEEHQPFASPQIGWAEQHPEDWWRASCVAVRKAIANSNLRAEDIACVGFRARCTAPSCWTRREVSFVPH